MAAARAASRDAMRRISAFSVVVWVLGLFWVGVSALVFFDDGVESADGAYDSEPWLNPNPTEATRDGDTWSGGDGDVIALSGLDTATPLHLAVPDDELYVRAAVTAEGGTALPGESSRPEEFTVDEYGQQYLVPPVSSIELWIDSDGEPWELTVTEATLDELSGTTSGVGPAAFVYRGDATSARVSVRGEYSVYISVVTGVSSEEVLSEDGSVDRTIAWQDAETAVFVIDAFDEVAWTIEPDEPEGGATAEPSSPPTTVSTDDDGG